MKKYVWIVWDGSLHGTSWICGIFDSEIKAKKFAAKEGLYDIRKEEVK